MTKSSVLGYAVRMGSNALSADYPCDANHALYNANNLQHFHDMSTQSRINWVASSTSSAPGGEISAKQHLVAFYFPVSISVKGGGFPEDLVVRVGAATAGGTLSLEAYITPADVPINTIDLDKYIAKLTGTATSNTGEWAIESRIGDQYDETTPPLIEQATMDTATFTDPANTTKQRSKMAMLRLSIYAFNAIGSDLGYIMGVSVREFHNQ